MSALTGTNGIDRLLRTGVHQPLPRPAAAVRVVAGVLFVVFALPKFVNHTQWVSDLGTYGLPSSSALVYLIGTAELVGGIALAVGFLTPVVSSLLALTMIGAVVLGGFVGGNPLSLTMAPLLLIASLFVLWSTRPATATPAPAR